MKKLFKKEKYYFSVCVSLFLSHTFHNSPILSLHLEMYKIFEWQRHIQKLSELVLSSTIYSFLLFTFLTVFKRIFFFLYYITACMQCAAVVLILFGALGICTMHSYHKIFQELSPTEQVSIQTFMDYNLLNFYVNFFLCIWWLRNYFVKVNQF